MGRAGMNSDAAAGPSSAARADGVGCPLTGAPPDGGTDRITCQEAVLSRAKAIFLGEFVQASGLGAVANQPTLRMILAADLVRAELWKEHCDAIRQPADCQGWPPCHRWAAEGTEEWRRTRRYLAAWKRSVLLDETTIRAEAWAAAVACC